MAVSKKIWSKLYEIVFFTVCVIVFVGSAIGFIFYAIAHDGLFFAIKERIEDMKVMIYGSSVIIGLILATILGALGQSIAYDLNERFPAIELTTAITIVTFISIGLFIIIPISLFIFNKIEKINLVVSVIACVLIGLPVSIWSFFIWVAGWVNLIRYFALTGACYLFGCKRHNHPEYQE